MLAYFALLAACQTVPDRDRAPPPARGDVNGMEVMPDAAARMTLRPDQVFVRGELIEPSAVPVYPPELLDRARDAQAVCVRFVVGRDGTVSNVRPGADAPDCPLAGADQAPFAAAAMAAVSQWEFFSNQVCTFPAGTPPERRCSGPGVTVVPVAVTLIYRFEFSQRDGAGVVERSVR